MQTLALSRNEPARLRAICAAVFLCSLAACGQHTVSVHPPAPKLRAQRQPRPESLSLHVPPEMSRYTHVAVAPVAVSGGIEAKYDLGQALDGVIANAAAANFARVVTVPTARCAEGTSGVLRAAFAKRPDISVRWLQGFVYVGGGASVEIPIAVSVQDCAGNPIWRGTAIGYGSRDTEQAVANYPGAEDFQPAVDDALRDLLEKLDALFARADLRGLGGVRQE